MKRKRRFKKIKELVFYVEPNETVQQTYDRMCMTLATKSEKFNKKYNVGKIPN